MLRTFGHDFLSLGEGLFELIVDIIEAATPRNAAAGGGQYPFG